MAKDKVKQKAAENAPEIPGGGEPQRQAVIFLGAGACAMMVAEQPPVGPLRVLDVLSRPIELAHDVFSTNKVSRETMDRCVQVMRGYKELLAEYGSGGEPVPVRLLATNVLTDVTNMDAFVNRLQTACGLHLEVMDDGEMTRLLYQNMQTMLQSHPELARKRSVVLHVGPGNTRLLLFERGRLAYYASYRMGAHRTGEAIIASDAGGSDSECSLIREHVRGVMEQLRHDAADALADVPDALVIFGPDFHCISSPLIVGDTITAEGLTRLVDEIADTPYNSRMERYEEDYVGVVALLPTAVIYQAVVSEFSPRSIFIAKEEYTHEFLRSLLNNSDNDSALEEEMLHFSMLQASRYKVDRAHSQQVRRLCTALFDNLQDLHGLGHHDRLLLKVAAILHEVGTYISPKKHHHHSQYIILNSEIFGLSRHDVEIVGLLARYHRHSTPSVQDRHYAELDLQDRLRVQKMAALLRVADALERAHAHRIANFTVRYKPRRLELLVPGVRDLTIENLALRSKADLFTEIFGYDIQLLPAE